MLLLTRLIELLFANRRLKTSKPYVFSALTGFAVLALLGIFGALLLALTAAGGLWLAYTQMLAAGLSVAIAALLTLVIVACLLVLVSAIAVRAWTSVQADIGHIFESQTPNPIPHLTPLVTPVLDKTVGAVGRVAGAFRRGLKHKTR